MALMQRRLYAAIWQKTNKLTGAYIASYVCTPPLRLSLQRLRAERQGRRHEKQCRRHPRYKPKRSRSKTVREAL